LLVTHDATDADAAGGPVVSLTDDPRHVVPLQGRSRRLA
jgi:hypothetical protein